MTVHWYCVKIPIDSLDVGVKEYEKVIIVTFYVRWYGHVGRRIFMATKKTAAKEEAAKAVTATVADTKTDEVKTAKETPAAKAEAVEETKRTTKKSAAEKAPAKKPGRKPAAEKKAPVKKEAAVNKAEVKEVLHIQFSGKSYATEDLVKIAKDVWKFDLNHDEKDFKTVELYVKPEESVVYYVINGDITGSFNI